MAKQPKKVKNPKNQGEKGKPIKGIKAKRDPISGAVVSTDNVGYQKAVKRKRAGKNILLQQKKIDNLEKRLASQESKLDQIIALLEDG